MEAMVRDHLSIVSCWNDAFLLFDIAFIFIVMSSALQMCTAKQKLSSGSFRVFMYMYRIELSIMQVLM